MAVPNTFFGMFEISVHVVGTILPINHFFCFDAPTMTKILHFTLYNVENLTKFIDILLSYFRVIRYIFFLQFRISLILVGCFKLKFTEIGWLSIPKKIVFFLSNLSKKNHFEKNSDFFEKWTKFSLHFLSEAV